MGQEVAVTPVQVVAMVSALANGGVYHAPHIVVGTYDDNQDADPPPFHPSPGRRIISQQVADEMKGMMEQVVLAGTGQHTQLNGYSSAGKTGTAQKVDAGGHGYSAHDVVASFAGYAPADHPAIAMLVVIDSPHPLHEGGVVAGPAWKRMGDRILPYLGIPHDLPINVPAATLAQRRAQEQNLPPHADDESFSVAARELLDADSSLPRDAVIIDGQQLGQGTPATAAGKSQAVIVQYQGGIEVPNFAGMPLRAVSALCEKLGLDPVLMGRGVARQQVPAAGARVAPGTRVVVQFTLREPQGHRP
jgi:cell division protein FtsI (penicillin-binding protein 3)